MNAVRIRPNVGYDAAGVAAAFGINPEAVCDAHVDGKLRAYKRSLVSDEPVFAGSTVLA